MIHFHGGQVTPVEAGEDTSIMVVSSAWRTAVRGRLRDLGITQSELARRVSASLVRGTSHRVSAPTISLILSGNRHPTVSIVNAIDRVLDVPDGIRMCVAILDTQAQSEAGDFVPPHDGDLAVPKDESAGECVSGTTSIVLAVPKDESAGECVSGTGSIPCDDPVLVASELRLARDAINADIIRLETVRVTIDERLAEAYEHRARLDVKIREQRAKRGQP